MNQSLQKIGVAAFWITWPALWLMLRFSNRTRGLIVFGDKIVVVKPWLSNGRWGLPGGGAHHSEDSLAALIREVEEEVGLSLSKQNCKKVGNKTYKQNGLSFRYQLFVIKLSDQPKLRAQRSEIGEAQWIAINELNSANSSFDVLDALSVLS